MERALGANAPATFAATSAAVPDVMEAGRLSEAVHWSLLNVPPQVFARLVACLTEDIADWVDGLDTPAHAVLWLEAHALPILAASDFLYNTASEFRDRPLPEQMFARVLRFALKLPIDDG